jgi:hypothetical protein
MSDTDEVQVPKTASDQQIWSQAPSAEPLDYTTQVRQPSPLVEPPLRRPRQSGTARPTAEPTGYRVRDFSPEARGASFSSTQSAPWTPPASGSEDLDYRTSADIDRPAPAAYSAPPAAPPVVVTPEEVPQSARLAPEEQPRSPEEHTLTRRELRELRNAAMPRPDEAQQPLGVPGRLPEDLQPTQSAELAAAMREFDQRFGAKDIPSLVEPPRGGTPASAAPLNAAAQFVAPPVASPAAAAPQTVAPPVVVPPVVAAPSAASEASARIAPAPQVASPLEPAAPLREVVTAPEVYAAPAGHWSNQESIDDAYELAGGPHSRNLAVSDAITTSALVLPSFPATSPFTGPVSSTGEVLITGSIDLPRSLGMNGLHPSRYDSPDIDAVIDAADREDSAPDSAPVRAIRAVSTHTSSQGIINAKRPKGNNLPMVLSITAGVMMVGVVVLIVAGMIFKIF